MFIPDPDFYQYRIPDPRSKNRGEKNFVCHTFLCNHKFHKIENFSGFEMVRKEVLTNFQRIIELLTQKIVTKLKNMGLRSGIRDPEKTFSGSRIQGSKRHRIPDPGSGSATLFL
jgi:hypothetical protein